DPSGTCCCSLIWFYRRRMVMAFEFETYREIVADVDDACTFTRAYEYSRTLRRESSQDGFGIFIGTMLRPHDAEYTNLRIVRLATEKAADKFVLFVGYTHLLIYFLLCDLLCCWFLSGQLLRHVSPSKRLVRM